MSLSQHTDEWEALVTKIARGPVLPSATGFLPNVRPMGRLDDYADPPPSLAGQHVNHEAARERHEALAEAHEAVRAIADRVDREHTEGNPVQHRQTPWVRHVLDATAALHAPLTDDADTRTILAQPEMSEPMGLAADELLDLLAYWAEHDGTITRSRAAGALRHCISVFLEAAERKLA